MPSRNYHKEPEEGSVVIAVVSHRGTAEARQKRAQRASFSLPKIAFVSALIVAAIALSFNTPFAQLEAPATEVQGNFIVLTATAVTSSATGPAPDAQSWHLLYWMLLAAALIPLELEWRKKND